MASDGHHALVLWFVQGDRSVLAVLPTAGLLNPCQVPSSRGASACAVASPPGAPEGRALEDALKVLIGLLASLVGSPAFRTF